MALLQTLNFGGAAIIHGTIRARHTHLTRQGTGGLIPYRQCCRLPAEAARSGLTKPDRYGLKQSEAEHGRCQARLSTMFAANGP